MLGLIEVIVVGFVVGFLAKFIIGGPGPSGFFLTAALGIAGSILATFAGRMLNWYQPGEPASFIGSFIGAIVLLLLYHMFLRNRGSASR